jgi:hypothetical protein
MAHSPPTPTTPHRWSRYIKRAPGVHQRKCERPKSSARPPTSRGHFAELERSAWRPAFGTPGIAGTEPWRTAGFGGRCINFLTSPIFWLGRFSSRIAVSWPFFFFCANVILVFDHLRRGSSLFEVGEPGREEHSAHDFARGAHCCPRLYHG